MLEVGDVTFGVENAIFATCLTLSDNWSGDFGPTANVLMGYTEVSYDFVDNDIVDSYITELGRDRSHQVAWYNSNNAESMLSDRWAAYVREGGSIVEYSARSGNRPVARSRVDMIELGRAGGVFLSRQLLLDDRTHEEVFTGLRLVTPGELVSTAFGGGFADLEPSSRTAAEAIEAATAWLRERGELPPDAVVERVIPISARTGPESAPVTHGHTVRYVREIDGLQVRSNTVEEYIAVLVSAHSVVGSSSYWSEIARDPSARWTGPVLEIGHAALLAADRISRTLKGGEIYIIEARPVMGTLGRDTLPGELTPAFLLRSDDGTHLVISALTGELLL